MLQKQESLAAGGSWNFGHWNYKPAYLNKKCPLLTDKKIFFFYLSCLRDPNDDQVMDTVPVSLLKSQWRR